jgi:PAS domain S-box-containing protein
MAINFSFQEAHFNRIFPFYILINQQMVVESTGTSLQKIFTTTRGKNFPEYFKIKQPVLTQPDFESLQSLTGQQVVIECFNEKQTDLKGQIDFLPESGQLLFIGSPWFDSIKTITQNKLSLQDFAFHDSMADRLQVMKTLEETNQKLKLLFKTVSHQKNELKNASKAIHDFALFPTQSPDPLIRINFAGDLLQNNPAAARFDFLEYEGNTYRNDIFFKLVAEKIDKQNKRWTIEARSENRDYSLVCVTMHDEGYINIYGTDITKQKKDQQELERLSIIIQQTVNAVIVTNAAGEIEWVNTAFEKVTGYTLKETFGKKPGSFLQGKDTNADTVGYMKEQIRKKEPFICEILNYKKSGESYWLRINGQPIFDSNGNVTQFFAIEEDITNEKIAQEKIQAAASRMSSLIGNMHAGMLLENQNRTIALINQRFCDLFNIPALPEQMTGADCSQAAEQSKYLFKNPELFVVGIHEILKNKKLVIAEKLEMADGRFLERDFIPIWNDGRYDGHLWVYEDITEKINADKKLEKQRKFYEEILDNIPSDIAVFDNSHRYLYVNPIAIKDPELRKWIVGKTDEDYVMHRNKPLSLVDRRRKIFKNVIETQKLKSWEEELKQPDGTYNYVMRNMFPVLNNENEVSLVIGYGIDITNIKNIQQQIEQSEKKYRDVIDNSLAIVTTHDMQGKFITVNPMVGKIYGYTDQEMVGHSLKEFIPEEDKLLFEEQYLEKIRKEKQLSGIFRVVSKKGHVVYTLFNNFLKEEDGREPYVIGFAVDITDRIQAEKELKIAKRVTEEMVQTKQNFLANMSHEIRTPMNAIMGMSRQLQKTHLNDKQQTYLDTITAASENLLFIINDILDLSKLEAGKLALEKIGFEPKLVVGTVMQVMNHKAEEKGLQLTNSFCDAQLSPILIGDPYRINQVLLNLVSNSIKFTETGSVDISCKIISQTALEQQVQITVKDTGIGMDPEFVKNLFQKFRQEDESVARRFGGTGLGMSITKELVDLMGGEIEVESEKGKGTMMSIRFTFEKGTEKDLPQKNISMVNAGILLNKKILVVDDNEMNRLVATTILQEYGVLVTEAVNGEEATSLMGKEHFDLVLMDIQMPVMNGLDATAYIRNELKSVVPVIALTANAIRGENEKCFAAGMNDYLSKPFEENQFIQIVCRWLDIKELNKAEETIVFEYEYTSTPLYDLSKLTDIAKGNETFIKKMVQLFIDQVPDAVNEIKHAFAAGDLGTVKSVAHRIKPSISSLGIVSIKEDIRNIELNTVELHAAGQLTKLISRIDAVINTVVLDLENRK